VQRLVGRRSRQSMAAAEASRRNSRSRLERGVLEQLGRSDASITILAEKFHMTLTGMKKHVGVLEQAGLVTTEKVGRERTCKLGPRRLEEETAWLSTLKALEVIGNSARLGELDVSIVD
jgi:DNA-binding transcriptional ArsR family regulator